ncbi:MAG: ABC transporter C-terminal domain-containing protein [Fusicatenibacter saccharivorans]
MHSISKKSNGRRRAEKQKWQEQCEQPADRSDHSVMMFDKKRYYNPGKILSRLKRQLEKYEEQLAESESRMSELQLEMMDPELSANYEQLMELQTQIDEENQVQGIPAGAHDGDRAGTGRAAEAERVKAR